MKTFKQIIEDWFLTYLKSHEDDFTFYQDLYYFMGYKLEDLGDKSHLEFLMNLNADQIWDVLFGWKNRDLLDSDLEERFLDMPYTSDIFRFIFKGDNAKDTRWYESFEFSEYFLDEYMEMAAEYDTLPEFFDDLTKGKLKMFSDDVWGHKQYLELYGEYCNDLEDYVKKLEDTGTISHEVARNPKCELHYVFVIKLAFEWFGRILASHLFPEKWYAK